VTAADELISPICGLKKIRFLAAVARRRLPASVLSVALKKLIFYIVHSKHVTKTQKYVKIVGREPSFFHHQRPAGVLALWLIKNLHQNETVSFSFSLT
jgi:hypothetical protein